MNSPCISATSTFLTFKAGGGAKGRFERIRVVPAELPNVEFLAAPKAYLPAVK